MLGLCTKSLENFQQRSIAMKASINNIDLAYDDHGSGTVVILLHGFPLCRQMWQPQISALTAAGYRVIAPDLRGFGESEAPDGPYSMEVYADDVVGLLDHLGIEQAVVCGMSMGGYVLFSLMERHAQRLAAAAFLVTRAAGDDEGGRTKRTKLAHAAREQGAQPVAEAFSNLLFAPETPRLRPELVARVEGWMLATDVRGLAGGLLAMRDRRDYTGVLGAIDLAALVVGAEQDKAIPLEHSRALHEHLPNSRLCIIPGAGHLANLEEPEAFNTCLLDFLAELKP
jgi:3-oxoadipate enol-lactonase